MTEYLVRRSIAESEHGQIWHLSLTGRSAVAQAGSLKVRVGSNATGQRHWFHLGLATYGAPELGIVRRLRTLTLCSDYAEAVEFFNPDGTADLLTILLKSAVLWLSRDHPGVSMFSEHSLSHATKSDATSMQVVTRRRSAFFNAVGAHFLPDDALALKAGAVSWPTHLTGLLPRHPIFVDLLPMEAKAALDEAGHPDDAWCTVMRNEGFSSGRAVNVVDGEPVFECHPNSSPTARSAARRIVQGVDLQGGQPSMHDLVLLLDEARDEVRLRRGTCRTGAIELEKSCAAGLSPTAVWSATAGACDWLPV